MSSAIFLLVVTYSLLSDPGQADGKFLAVFPSKQACEEAKVAAADINRQFENQNKAIATLHCLRHPVAKAETKTF